MKFLKKMMKVLTVTMAAILMVTACSNNGGGTNSKVLNLAEVDPSNNLNSITTAEAVNFRIIRNFQEGLFRKNIANEYEAGMAESWEMDETGTVYTFKLRDTKWSNGDPVTADDFVFAWNKVATVQDSAYKNYTDLIKNGKGLTTGEKTAKDFGVKALDDKTLEVVLESPTAYFADLLTTMTMSPINEKFYNEVGGDSVYGTTADTVLSNGAYVLKNYDSASGYTLEKNNDYWDAKNVQVEAVNVRVVSSLDTQGVMWDNGELDKIELLGDLVEKYDSAKELERQKEPRTGYIYLSGTTSTPDKVLSNHNFRAAVAHAFDKELLTDTILKDGSVPSDYLVPTGFVKNDKGQDFREYSGKFNEPYFNVAKAKEYLEKAKAELGDTPLTFTLNCPDVQPTKKMLESVVAQVNENLPGVNATLQTHPRATYYNTLFEHGTPSGYSGWGADILDPFTFTDLFIKGTSFNFPEYQSEAYNKYTQEAASAESMLNQEKRWTAFANAETTLIEDYVVIPIFQKGTKILVKDNIEHFTGTNDQPVFDYRLIQFK